MKCQRIILAKNLIDFYSHTIKYNWTNIKNKTFLIRCTLKGTMLSRNSNYSRFYFVFVAGAILYFMNNIAKCFSENIQVCQSDLYLKIS